MSNYQIVDLKPWLTGDWMGCKIYMHQTLDSTQAEAKRLATDSALHGTVVVANEQLSGRGRLGREWHSGADKGVWLSAVIRPEIAIQHLPQITLLTALAIKQTLNDLYGIEVLIKWPNDIYLNRRKLAGILTEALTVAGAIDCLIVGIGLNTDVDETATELADKRIALEEVLGYQPDKLQLISILLNRLGEFIDVYEQHGFAPFLEQYRASLYGKGEEVIIDGKLIARISAVNLQGELIVVDVSGFEHTIVNGEITFMG